MHPGDPVGALAMEVVVNPVVLVNGYLAPRAFLKPLAWRLRRRGIADVHRARLSPLCVQDLRRLAADLRRSVEAVCARTGAPRVDLVGVSQGGLVAFAYLHLEGGAERVERFVALGTPFGGTWFGLVGLPLLGGISRGLWQTFPTSRLLADLRARGIPEGVRIVSIAIPGDMVSPPGACRLDGADFRLAPPSRSPLAHQALAVSAACADLTAEILTAPR